MKKFLLAAFAALLALAGLATFSAPAQAATETTPAINSFSASPATFYPTVRDGFRDGVSFEGWADTIWDEDGYEADQTWNITVRNGSGFKVAERNGNAPDWDGAYWDWSGKNQRIGTPVRVGTYKATLTVTNDSTGETATATRTLYAKSDTVNKRITKTRTGTDTSARSHSSSCYIDRDWGTSHLSLDCWGGREAVARYGFTLPSNARNATWSMSGERNCCDDGRVVKTGWRTGDHFDVRVRVTNWASYTVKRANVTYTTTVRR